jgi:hypothetical protein
MTSSRLRKLERILQEIEEEEARRKKWAAFERKKLEELRAKQRAEAQQPHAAVRKKGGWVLLPKNKNVPPGSPDTAK